MIDTETVLAASSLLLGIHTYFALCGQDSVRVLFIGMLLRQIYRTTLTVHWDSPTILSIYVDDDELFSSQTYLALCAGGSMMQSQPPVIRMYAVMFVLFEIAVAVFLKGEHNVDIYIAIMTYITVCYWTRI